MIKDDPQRKQMHLSLLALILDIAIFCLLLLEQIFSPKHPGLTLFLLITMIFSVGLLSFAIISRTYLWRRLDKRRERVMQGDTSLLAHEQPVPDAFAVPVPAYIHLRSRWQIIAVFFGIIALVILIAFFIIPPLTGNTQTLTYIMLGAIFGITLLALAVGFIITYIQLKSNSYYAIEISPEGLTTYYNGKVRTVYWYEARVFAIISGKKGRLPTYELASTRTVARWIQLPHRSWYFYKTEVPYEQYKQQMSALLGYIAARTNLPLYDLRERPAK